MTKIVSNNTDEFGLNNYYNGGRLANAYNLGDTAMLQQFTDSYGGYDSSTLFEVMRFHVESYIMGGSYKTYQGTQELLNGYENDVAARVNGGSFY